MRKRRRTTPPHSSPAISLKASFFKALATGNYLQTMAIVCYRVQYDNPALIASQNRNQRAFADWLFHLSTITNQVSLLIEKILGNKKGKTTFLHGDKKIKTKSKKYGKK